MFYSFFPSQATLLPLHVYAYSLVSNPKVYLTYAVYLGLIMHYTQQSNETRLGANATYDPLFLP